MRLWHGSNIFGQMDMYIRMYDDLKRGEGDNPTLGIVLCTETDEDIAKYSVLHGNEQLLKKIFQIAAWRWRRETQEKVMTGFLKKK